MSSVSEYRVLRMFVSSANTPQSRVLKPICFYQAENLFHGHTQRVAFMDIGGNACTIAAFRKWETTRRLRDPSIIRRRAGSYRRYGVRRSIRASRSKSPLRLPVSRESTTDCRNPTSREAGDFYITLRRLAFCSFFK